MPFSLRIDPKTEAALRRLAKATGQSKSWIVREALEQYGSAAAKQAESSDAGTPTALDRVGAFIGVVSTGGQFSTETHTKYRAALQRKRRDRGPR